MHSLQHKCFIDGRHPHHLFPVDNLGLVFFPALSGLSFAKKILPYLALCVASKHVLCLVISICKGAAVEP